MKAKTSVSLSAELLSAIDRAVGRGGSRSAFLEEAGWRRVAELRRRRRDARDRSILDRAAGRLNREALEVLEYQEPA